MSVDAREPWPFRLVRWVAGLRHKPPNYWRSRALVAGALLLLVALTPNGLLYLALVPFVLVLALPLILAAAFYVLVGSAIFYGWRWVLEAVRSIAEGHDEPWEYFVSQARLFGRRFWANTGADTGEAGPRCGPQQSEADARRDPFAVLGIAPTATWPEIVSAYRRQAKLHHPDLARDPFERARSTRHMQELNWAYTALRHRRYGTAA